MYAVLYYLKSVQYEIKSTACWFEPLVNKLQECHCSVRPLHQLAQATCLPATDLTHTEISNVNTKILGVWCHRAYTKPSKRIYGSLHLIKDII
jgi:hypothetical protein